MYLLVWWKHKYSFLWFSMKYLYWKQCFQLFWLIFFLKWLHEFFTRRSNYFRRKKNKMRFFFLCLSGWFFGLGRRRVSPFGRHCSMSTNRCIFFGLQRWVEASNDLRTSSIGQSKHEVGQSWQLGPGCVRPFLYCVILSIERKKQRLT